MNGYPREQRKQSASNGWLAAKKKRVVSNLDTSWTQNNWNMHPEMVCLRLDLFEAAFSKSLAKKKRVGCKLQAGKRSLQLVPSCKQRQKKLQAAAPAKKKKLQAAAAAPAPRAANVPPVDPRGWPGYQLEKCFESISILFTKLRSSKAACCKPNKDV